IEAPRTMASAELARLAVSSTTAGGLPGPAPVVSLPEFMAALTTPGPPVTTTRRTPGCFMSALALSMVGCSIDTSTSRGPPTDWIASLSRWTYQLQTRAADGCTLNTTALPPATMPIALHSTVSVGLVVGVTDRMTP